MPKKLLFVETKQDADTLAAALQGGLNVHSQTLNGFAQHAHTG